MGRMPVFLYDDFAWIPYMGTNLSIVNFGFYGGLWNKVVLLKEVVHQMNNITSSEYQQKMRLLLDARWHFTYPGVLNQIEMLINDPFGPKGGNLVCTEHPRSERCCGRRRVRK